MSSNTNQAADPSMEEILASIRRIISDDDAPEEVAPEAKAEPVAVPEPEAEPEEVMDDANSDIDAMLADMEAEENEAGDNVTAMTDFETAPEPEDDDDIFDLTDIVEDEGEVEDKPEAVHGKALVGVEDQDLCFDDPPETKAEPVERPAPVPPSQPSEGLLSPDAAADASAAFGVLANTILTSSGNSRTLEDLVQDLLRPMLKSWLDVNLPPLVERLVREEIERVARQGR